MQQHPPKDFDEFDTKRNLEIASKVTLVWLVVVFILFQLELFTKPEGALW